MAKNNLATKDDIKNLKDDIESRILESEVKVLGELKDFREDFATHQFSHMRINDELQEHGRRLKKLETTITI